ncbi:unnamed protein product [Urochloa humidicola]
MALWNGLGQAATVAQLAGLDAGGLISMIVQSVQTVRRNREECRQLMHHVMMIGDLLQMLQQSDMMQRPGIRRPLDGLQDTLQQAYMLVASCQQSNIMYRFLMSGSQAQKFRDVRDRIDAYLRIYPLISHIDTRHFINGLYSHTHPSGTQASQEVLGSFPSNSNQPSRTEGGSFSDNGIDQQEVQAVIEPFAVEELRQDGPRNAEVLPNRRQKFRWFWWAPRDTSTSQSIRRLIDHEGTGGFTVFKFSQLAASTNNFSSHNIIGRGGYGDVYKGILPNGFAVAVKVRREKSTHSLCQFVNEVQIIPKLQHANIVKLLGCCIEGDNRILVYEYMPRGSLHYIIHELRAGVSLAWPVRFKIAEGIVQGAGYLQQHSRLRVIHGDLKSSNILLDSDMTPRIADFGMAVVLSSDEDKKETTTLAGTPGYMDPEFCRTSIISMKSDVYAFGINFLEIITAQHAIIEPLTSRLLLADYAWELWSSGRAMEMVDASLHNEPRISHIVRCVQIALLCVQANWVDRPTMSDVLMMLKCETMSLPAPRPPANTSNRLIGGWPANASGTAESRTYESVESSTAEEEERASYFSCCSSDVDNSDTISIA